MIEFVLKMPRIAAKIQRSVPCPDFPLLFCVHSSELGQTFYPVLETPKNIADKTYRRRNVLRELFNFLRSFKSLDTINHSRVLYQLQLQLPSAASPTWPKGLPTPPRRPSR